MKKKTKDRSQSKVKEAAPATGDTLHISSRGGRGRGSSDGPRGPRGRGSDRGRGTTRGGRAGSTVNGTRNTSAEKPLLESTTPGISGAWDEVPKADGVTGAWDQPGDTDTTPLDSSWEHVTVPEATPAATTEAPKPLKPDGTRSWASMFTKPAPVPVPPKTPQPAIQEAEIEAPAAAEPTVEEDMPGLPPPISVEHPVVETSATPPISAMEPSEPALEITPSKDLLTETNLEQLPDMSEPAPVATAASTAASTIDQRTAAGGNTPLITSQQPVPRPPMGGFATSAFKATGGAGRSASFNRRLAEQQEAVVMPGKQPVDRAAVQFGSMGLNGTAEDGDVDSDREEPETRAQPPQHSPIAPRASLPPASQASSLLSQPLAGESLPTPRQAPGLPPLNQQQPAQDSVPDQAAQQPSQSGYPYNQYGRYGSQPTPQDTAAPTQKPYEPFGQQIQQHQQYDGYPSTSQPHTQGPSHQAPSQSGGYSSAPNDMSSYYTSDNQRNAYQNFYNNYGQQPQQSQQSQQDSGSSQQKVGSAFGTSAPEQAPQYPTSNQPPARYSQTNEAQTSGQSTPNPSLPSQHPAQSQPGHSQPGHSMHQQQGQTGNQQHGGYPYGHPSYAYGSPYGYYNQHVSNHPYGRDRPMYDDVRRYDDQYLTHNPQFGYGGNQGGYGGGPFGGGAGGKQGMYGQPHQGYPQNAYDQHSSSPANVGGFGQHAAPNRDGGPTSGGLGNYGRTGSTQPTEGQQGYGASGEYNMPDVFGRSQSGYPGSNQPQHPQNNQQSGNTSGNNNNEDSLRTYDSTSKGGPSGPSPSLGQPGGGRPSSGMQQNVPPQGQQGYGAYPMHGQQHASQYGASPGGLGGHHQSQAGGQSHQASGYGGYGAGFGSYYGNNARGGWAGSYGH